MDTDKQSSARGSTTLAENTVEIGQTACVDWVSCSFRIRSDFEKIYNLIGISDLTNLETIQGSRYEFAGYDKTYRLGFIDLMHYFDDEHSIDCWFLNMSGQGCRQFEISSTFDFQTLFGVLANVQAVYTRLDIAIDDFENIYTVNQFRNAVYNKQCVTHLKSWGNHTRGLIATGSDHVTMDNFYLGSRSSRFFINVYDKKLERLDKSIEVDVKTWVRTEVRFSYEYADDFITHIIVSPDTIGIKIREFLNAKIVFLKPSVIKKFEQKEEGFTNRSRLAEDKKNHAEWWRKFLNTTKKLNLTQRKPEKTLVESKEWITRQVAITLALLKEYQPESFNVFMSRVLKIGENNMKKQHIRKLENQRMLDKQILLFDQKVNERKVFEKPGKVKDKKKLLDVYWNQVDEQKEKEKKSTPLG